MTPLQELKTHLDFLKGAGRELVSINFVEQKLKESEQGNKSLTGYNDRRGDLLHGDSFSHSADKNRYSAKLTSNSGRITC